MKWFKKRSLRKNLFKKIVLKSSNNYQNDKELKKILKDVIQRCIIGFNTLGIPQKEEELFFNFSYIKRKYDIDKVLMVTDDISRFS